MVTNVTVVVGGQYGSEGKGAVTAHLARGLGEQDTVVRVAGPNAGHTAYDKDGREWKLRAAPVAAVANPKCQLHIAAGSEVDMGVLFDELASLDNAGHDASNRLTIHPSATILDPRHIGIERATGIVGRIGSTGKGIGAARADRIARVADTVRDVRSLDVYQSVDGPFQFDGASNVIIEGTQGYGLGLHHRNYPQVTSSDCRAIDFLAMAGISPWDKRVWQMKVVVVARCFPIRVAGNSGPLKGETTWAELGLPEERTTVTGKIRRVGAWDDDLLHEAIEANGGGDWNTDVQLALTMLDQKYPEVRGMTQFDQLPDHVVKFLEELQDEFETDITLVGTSPTTMIEVSI